VLALSDRKPFTWFRVSGLFGIISPILAFILISLAILYAPWFSWTGNALSDLGVHDESAVLFNSGLIVGGILSIVFAVGVMRFYKNQTVDRDGAFFLLLAGIFLASIGIFPETAPNNIHYIVSVAFFAVFPVALLIQSAALLSTPAHRKLGAFTLVMSITAVIPWTIWMPLKPYRGVAIPELISALAAATWSIIMGSTLLRKNKPPSL
jgi:hypothetical membrane protein